MRVWSPINIHAKFQVDHSTHNKNLGEGSNEPFLPFEAMFGQKAWGLKG